MFVYASVVFLLLLLLLQTATKALFTQQSVGQSSWTHLLASDEKVVLPCLSVSVCNFSFLFVTNTQPPTPPVPAFPFCLKEFQQEKSSIFFFFSVFIFLLTRLSGDVRKVTHFLTELAPPNTNLAIREGIRKRGKEDKDDYFIN